MNYQGRPIWEILIIAFSTDSDEMLTCGECTAMMEYLADQAVEGATLAELKSNAFLVFKHCNACDDHFERHILEMEARIRYRTRTNG